MVMLSHPVSSWVSCASNESNRFINTVKVSEQLRLSLTNLVINGCELLTHFSQIPSQPNIKKSSSGCLLIYLISG